MTGIDPADPHAPGSRDCYERSPYLSLKHTSYFQVYDELLARWRGRTFTFVEIGVLNGGSLFMWRDYFGPQARIIGVDFNPGARRWESEGFEIHIGDQSDPAFWERFFAAVGAVDVILDDGGHTNEQQIVTTLRGVPQVRDGGMLIVEDTHASYMKALGNPSPYSFMNYAKRLVDGVNGRFPGLDIPAHPLAGAVYSIGFYESIVCFHVDRRRCFVSAPTTNRGASLGAEDFRHRDSRFGAVVALRARLAQRFAALKRVAPVRAVVRAFFANLLYLQARLRSRRLRRYFR